MEIRAATFLDVQAIAQLHAASWRYAYRGALSDEYLAGDIVADRTAVWTQRLGTGNSNQHVAVAIEHDDLIGFACAFRRSDDVWGTMLDNIHVAQGSQRQGVGLALMQSISDWCQLYAPDAGLFLWVLQSNLVAQRFYKALDAQNVGEDMWVPPGGGEVPRFRFAWHNVRALKNAIDPFC